MRAVASIRKRLARFCDADAVIGEFEMGPGKLDLRHVTRDAQAPRDRAGFCGSSFLSLGFGRGGGLQAPA